MKNQNNAKIMKNEWDHTSTVFGCYCDAQNVSNSTAATTTPWPLTHTITFFNFLTWVCDSARPISILPPFLSLSLPLSNNWLSFFSYYKIVFTLYWSKQEWPPHRLIYLNNSSSVSGTVWKGMRVVTVLEEVCYWGWVFRFQRLLPFRMFLWLVSVSQDVSSLLLLWCRGYLSAAMLYHDGHWL